MRYGAGGCLRDKNHEIKNKIIEFVKKETVLTAAMVLAVLSAVIIPPDTEYIGYIDFRTLAILFCLMTVMAGLQKLGIFRRVARILLQHTHNVIALAEILVLLCFFFSMLIANDVALIAFVPFYVYGTPSVRRGGCPETGSSVVVLQTIAANLGSMLTPIGNPQNLYLYGKIQMSPIAFIKLMLPYSAVSLLFCLSVRRLRRNTVALRSEMWQGRCRQKMPGRKRQDGGDICLCFIFDIIFVVSVNGGAYDSLSGNAWNCGAWGWNLDHTIIGKVDYSLLLTFMGFFIFIGNIGRMPALQLLQKIIEGREVMTAVAASQVISNVPAALLLSGFTENVKALIVGTNLGGLGTMIASMAALISYKQVASQIPGEKKQYLDGLQWPMWAFCFHYYL